MKGPVGPVNKEMDMNVCGGCGFAYQAESCPRCDIKGIPKRKGRGPGKKPSLVCTSLRLSREVMDYFDQNFPHNKQAKMREILTDYINSHKQGANHGT
jgi:hypothetical protein